MSVSEVRWIYWALVILILGFAALVYYRLWRADFSGLIREAGSTKASLSRFQFLLFTFVIAGLYVVFCLDTGDFIEIPGSVLALMGISGGSYVISKGISEETRKTLASGPDPAEQ
jgi:hypothetical protein